MVLLKMNDFTKEELVELMDALGWKADRGQHTVLSLNLEEKIQAMIENYCEHESKCNHDWSVGFGSIHSPVVYCKLCQCQKPELTTQEFNQVMGIV